MRCTPDNLRKDKSVEPPKIIIKKVDGAFIIKVEPDAHLRAIYTIHKPRKGSTIEENKEDPNQKP